MTNQLLFILCSFGAVASVAFFASRLLLAKGDHLRLRDRLRSGPYTRLRQSKPHVGKLLQRLGQAAAEPFMPKKTEKVSSLRQNLAHAGIYAPSAFKVLVGAKLLCLCGGILLGYLTGTAIDQLLFGLSLGGIFGYLAPLMWLKFKIKSNQMALTIALPDALDLMVVCVEAGLTVDSALQRVGQEMSLAHPALSRELGMAHMETRVGLARTEALKNLGLRTGNAALQSLAAMLVQAERFGTSIATALRVHSETLRATRQMAAEELAGKASVKMSFPLVLCIFPATFIVLAGPMVLQLLKSSLFN